MTEMTRYTPPQNSAFPSPEAQVACASGGLPKSTRCACVGGSVLLAEKEIINLSFSGNYTRCTPHAPTCASGGNLGSFPADHATRCTLPHTRASGDLARSETNLPPALDADVDELVARATADAESLLGVVAAPDEPDGVRIVGGLAAPTVWGLCSGSGHAFARAHGFPSGLAVMVAGRRIAALHAAAAAETAGQLLVELRVPATAAARLVARCRDSSDTMATVAIEHTAAHELAHALAADTDTALDDARANALRDLPATFSRVDTPEISAAHHGPAWAAAAAIIYSRCQGIRVAVAGKWAALSHDEFVRYGMQYPEVAKAVAHIPYDAPLRSLLRDRDFMVRVEAAVPSREERVALIARRQHTAPPGVPTVAAEDVSGGREAALHDERDEA